MSLIKGVIGNIEKNSQYRNFESLFISERRTEITDMTDNLTKDEVVDILDSFDEMVHDQNPNIITVKECIEKAIKNGIIEPDILNANNKYRELAISTINTVEAELFDVLPEPEENDEQPEEDSSISKIYGEMYYNLEDNLTELFKTYKF